MTTRPVDYSVPTRSGKCPRQWVAYCAQAGTITFEHLNVRREVEWKIENMTRDVFDQYYKKQGLGPRVRYRSITTRDQLRSKPDHLFNGMSNMLADHNMMYYCYANDFFVLLPDIFIYGGQLPKLPGMDGYKPTTLTETEKRAFWTKFGDDTSDSSDFFIEPILNIPDYVVYFPALDPDIRNLTPAIAERLEAACSSIRQWIISGYKGVDDHRLHHYVVFWIKLPVVGPCLKVQVEYLNPCLFHNYYHYMKNRMYNLNLILEIIRNYEDYQDRLGSLEVYAVSSGESRRGGEWKRAYQQGGSGDPGNFKTVAALKWPLDGSLLTVDIQGDRLRESAYYFTVPPSRILHESVLLVTIVNILFPTSISTIKVGRGCSISDDAA